MNKFYLAFISILILNSCRKDSSSFVNESQSNGNKCLVTQLVSSDGLNDQINTYSMDSILTKVEKNEYGDFPVTEYLHAENSKQFIRFEDSEMPESAKTRIYLNADGNIDKEVLISLNADGHTYTEDPDHVNHFIYNAKKQLIRADLNIDEESIYTFAYDDKGRITRVGMEEEGEEFCVLDGFSYSDESKKDNLVILDVFDDLPGQFIPSLRNAYITRFKMSFSEEIDPDFPIGLGDDMEFEYNYTFSNGKLTKIRATLNTGDSHDVIDLKVKLNCID